jgi:hypothetical protein
MAEEADAKGTGDTEKEMQETPGDVVTRWIRELDAADKTEKKWREQADKIVSLYKDQRKEAEGTQTTRRFNILYANTEVLKGALYSRCPTPDVRRRWLDRDTVGRLAALILNRAVTATIEFTDLHGTLKQVVSDMVLPGRGQACVKYKPTINSYEDRVAVDAPAEGVTLPEDVKQDEQGYFRMEAVEEVVAEKVEIDYVEWKFFRMSPAKRWKKVRWIAYGELMTRDDLVKLCGKEIGNQVALNWIPPGMEDNEQNEIFKRALVWNIYNLTERKCIVVCEGYKDAPLKEIEDPLKLEGFFPSPAPLYAISTTDSMVPVPEYTVYQDHALDLDALEERIAVLTDALRRRGVFDKSVPELEEMAKSSDNKFIGIEDYSKFAEKGGLDSAFQEYDLSNLASVLAELMKQAEAKKAQIYEIVGISDIMRGATKANETLGAQQLKDQWGSVRISPRQDDVQRFARDVIRLVAEVIAEHFSAQTLQQMTGIELPLNDSDKATRQAANPEDPAGKRPTWEKVLQVLRSDKLRSFKINIETDSTIKGRADQEQKNRIELIGNVTGFLEKALPAVQAGLVPKKVASELLMFGVRAFPAGSQLEELLDEWASGGVDELLQGKQQAPQGQQQPSPAEQAQTVELQKQAAHADKLRDIDVQKKNAELVSARAKAYTDLAEAEAKKPGTQLDLLTKQAKLMGILDPGADVAGAGADPLQGATLQ